MKQILILLALLSLGSLLYFTFNTNQEKALKELPFLGNKGHTIKDFSFTNQDGNTVTLANVKGKILVVEYFFTTCQSICPIMNTQMMRVDSATKGMQNFTILSHTVDPETDTQAAMKAYSARHNPSSNWLFLTGDKAELYSIARESYLLDAAENATKNIGEDFIHTPDFILIDQNGRLRGAYNGTKLDEVDKLIADVKILVESIN
ncbi:MAG: SCO family protein [Flavobacteriaceae bacterium]|nr:SCO family protein [Flavobacteriaceae bacterium]